ncbi:homoserine O-acetyltransferase [Desulfovibrio mangrovi]|uniref:homoserine O-acetyltransferase MetX n=1 Tax=Desulfovibrio mangrovi TaxID=2976983 RepID=UPI00224502F4|nr:homoserine O-acetyltransferase [Desulfovibrio mangrovi]UZP67227.1 homoserine O-acetyltransferase [Desulfovibrio mangrovi]
MTQSNCSGAETASNGVCLFTLPEPLVFRSGAELSGVQLAYETFGTLAADKSNAVLVCHALTGDSHVASSVHGGQVKPGWWDEYVGPGKPVDTDRFFVICSNILGSCYGSSGPASINPATGSPYGLDFPVVTITDMVRAQRQLVRHFGISRLCAVTGGSLGGMQVLEWAARYPEMVAAAVPIATTTRHSAQAIAFNEVARQSVISDPNWQQGAYYGGPAPDLGLAVARMIGHITYLSDESMHVKFGRNLQNREQLSFNFETDFQVESYLHHQGRKFVQRFDANSFLYVTKAADYFDLELEKPESYASQAFKSSDTRFLVISFTSDWLYPSYQSKTLVTHLQRAGRDVSFCDITEKWGHDAFLLPNNHFADILGGFFSHVR